MKYYKYFDDYSGIISGFRYIEVDDKGVSFREVTLDGDFCLGSNILYPYYGMRISDQPVDYDSLEEAESIAESEFDEAWNKHSAQNYFRWEFTKIEYSIGSSVEGSLVIFYPQGVIVNLGNSVLAVADYEACRASTNPEFMYPGHRVTALVSGYDELNQWIILDSPTVHSEKIIVK